MSDNPRFLDYCSLLDRRYPREELSPEAQADLESLRTELVSLLDHCDARCNGCITAATIKGRLSTLLFGDKG